MCAVGQRPRSPPMSIDKRSCQLCAACAGLLFARFYGLLSPGPYAPWVSLSTREAGAVRWGRPLGSNVCSPCGCELSHRSDAAPVL
jgi:hypothetical protein